eukprot:1440524-Amphidinium_carterae.1
MAAPLRLHPCSKPKNSSPKASKTAFSAKDDADSGQSRLGQNSIHAGSTLCPKAAEATDQ